MNSPSPQMLSPHRTVGRLVGLLLVGSEEGSFVVAQEEKKVILVKKYFQAQFLFITCIR
jgi:hypothetical protein